MPPLKKNFVILFRVFGIVMILGGLVCFAMTAAVLSDGSLMPPDDQASGYFGRIFNRPSFLMPFYIGLLAGVFQCFCGYIAVRYATEPIKAARTIVLAVFTSMFWLAYCLAFFGSLAYGSSLAMRLYPLTVVAGFVMSTGFLFVSVRYRRNLPRNYRDINPMSWRDSR